MNGLQGLGKILVAVGIAAIVLGGVLWAASRLGVGSLPGDIRLEGQRWGCYLPIATSLLLSLLLTIVLNLLLRWFGK